MTFRQLFATTSTSVTDNRRGSCKCIATELNKKPGLLFKKVLNSGFRSVLVDFDDFVGQTCFFKVTNNRLWCFHWVQLLERLSPAVVTIHVK